MQKTIAVIGAGFAGMSAAALLAKHGFTVTLLEKNQGPGGRASLLQEAGFKFDKGPSFYWMPDIFERFFRQFNKSASDYYELIRLDPSYKVFWKDREPVTMPARLEDITGLFESLERGAGHQLNLFLTEAKKKYDTGMGRFVYLPSLRLTEYLSIDLFRQSLKLDLFSSVSGHIAHYFKSPYLRQLLEFPVLFLGAKPSSTPALYSMMNYADLVLGSWYPSGGMYEVSKAFYQTGKEQGVQFLFNQEVQSIRGLPDKRMKLTTHGGFDQDFDYIVSGADYHHTENSLLQSRDRSYPEAYWNTRTMAPSALLYFLGFDRRIDKLEHHSLFFDAPFDQHAREIYDRPDWPADPLFYTNSSSLTDAHCAPAGHHNLVALIPVSVELKDDETIRQRYLDIILQRLANHTGVDVRKHLVYQKSYANADFIKEYHSLKGNAYGLANTLLQTGPFRPKIRSKKLPNLFYCGQLTVPGPGLPPSIISGEIVANYIHQMSKQ